MVKNTTGEKKKFARDVYSSPSSFSGLVDSLDAERQAQREEFLKREQSPSKGPCQKLSPKKPRKKSKSRPLTFEEKLELTNQWLEENFPHLFAADDYMPLDVFIVRDLKNNYKNNFLKKGYPEGLVIKAAISRYKANLGYLTCLLKGACRYNLAGDVCGIVTKEEEEEARKILETL